jgi:hypothetical protein
MNEKVTVIGQEVAVAYFRGTIPSLALKTGKTTENLSLSSLWHNRASNLVIQVPGAV